MDDEERQLIDDEIPVMDRGYLDCAPGEGRWDWGFKYSREAYEKEVRLRKKYRGWANWN